MGQWTAAIRATCSARACLMVCRGPGRQGMSMMTIARRARRLGFAAMVCGVLGLLACSGAGAATAPSTEGPGTPEFVPSQVVVRFQDQHLARAVRLPGAVGVHQATRALNSNPAVAYA